RGGGKQGELLLDEGRGLTLKHALRALQSARLTGGDQMRPLSATPLLVFALCMLTPGNGASPRAQTSGRDAATCAALMTLQLQGVSLSITKAEWHPAGSPAQPAGRGAAAGGGTLPAYCRADGTIDRRAGADGKTYGIGFALALPADWNGRFLFQG